MITSNRLSSVTFTGDINTTIAYNTSENDGSPGAISILTLAIGNNTIALPTGGSTPVSATIVPPEGNLATITLKGVNGDTGVRINPTDPTILTFDPDALPASFVLTASAEIIGLTIVWA